MKKGYSVENGFIYENDNCILVDNDKIINKVLNLPLKECEIYEFTDKDTIGVWKIKNKN